MLCLITGEVFEPGPFEKPAKVARQRPKKGPPQRINSWRQGNSFAPLAAQRKKTAMGKTRRRKIVMEKKEKIVLLCVILISR